MSTKARVLLIDDDPNFLRAHARLLRTAGHEVETAEDGLAGVAAYERTRYDVVVSDVNMPGLDGLGVLARIKAMDPTAQVILVTANPSDALRVQALGGGARRMMGKAEASTQLVGEVAGAVRERRATNAAGMSFLVWHPV